MAKNRQAALAEAQAQHYVLVRTRNTALQNAYYQWCKTQPWHPYIRVTAGPRYAHLHLDMFPVHDVTGNWVRGARPAIQDEMRILTRACFDRTKDRWARKGWIGIGSDILDAHGMPLDVAVELIGQLWPIITRPEHYYA